MIVAIVGTERPTPPINKDSLLEKEFLHFDELVASISSPDERFRNGLVLLTLHKNEPLPTYIRSEINYYLGSMTAKARQWNAAIIIPDIVQAQLLKSKRIYPSLKHLHVHIRPRDMDNSIDAPPVDAALGKVGFLETEKLLLLESLLGSRRQYLEEVVHVLREEKVFCLKLGGDVTPQNEYTIVKFDSASVVNKEYKNYGDVNNLFHETTGDFIATEYTTWRDKTYTLAPPQGEDYDLFKVISSTVESVGNVADWPRQTLKEQWNDLSTSGDVHKIINSVFDILLLLYSAGDKVQAEPGLKSRSIAEVYWDFYKGHIMPADFIVQVDLNEISFQDAPEETPQVIPSNPGSKVAGWRFKVEEIKLRKNTENEAGAPDISLLVGKVEDGRKRMAELKLGTLEDFEKRRRLYLSGIREGKILPYFQGRLESTFEARLLRTVKALKLGPERLIDGPLNTSQILFITECHHLNPIFFYHQLSRGSATDPAFQFNSLSTWIHGDLNTGNIIPTPTGDARLIDFARLVKDGPLEFDFAELEVDIRIRNLVSLCKTMRKENLSLKEIVKEMFTFEMSLVEVLRRTETEEDLERRVTPIYKPAFRVFAQIRKRLVESYQTLTGSPLSGPDVLGAYMTAIYFESLAAVNFAPETLAKIWALVSATTACDIIFQDQTQALGATPGQG